MEEGQWDIKEIKQLKKKQLLQGNLFMLLLFVLNVYFFESGQFILVIWVLLAYLLLVLMQSIYILKTGKQLGTKTSRRLQKFDRHRFGEKRWKRNKIGEIVLFIVLGVGLAVLLFVIDFSSPNQNVLGVALPFIGGWIGYNLGVIANMKNLNEQPEHG